MVGGTAACAVPKRIVALRLPKCRLLNVMFQTEAWQSRLSALKNIPPVLQMIWNASRIFTGLSIGLRVVAALAPVSMLWISKMIVDHVVAKSYQGIWTLLLAEFALACTAAMLGRIVDHCDSRMQRPNH